MKIRSGISVISDHQGTGQFLEKGSTYRLRIKLWLNKGKSVVWSDDVANINTELSSDGTELTADYRLHRGSLIPGIYYGIMDMRIGGTRQFKIAPHLAYGNKGLGGMIPPDALLTAEVCIIDKVK